MTHDEVLDGEVLDAYVSGRLTPDDRAAFEEHFFECDVCFDAVHAEDALRRAVRHLASSERLGVEIDRSAIEARPRRAAVLGIAAAVTLLAVAGGWMVRSRLSDVRSQLSTAQQRAADLERAVAEARQSAAAAGRPEPNVPLAILQTARDASRVALPIPDTAARFLLWFDDVPASMTPVSIAVATPDGRFAARIDEVRPNQYGALVVSVPAAGITSGEYVVTVVAAARAAPIGRYTLDVTRTTR